MQIKVKAKTEQFCRLSDELRITDKEASVELTTMVRRRLRDGSLIETKKRGNDK